MSLALSVAKDLVRLSLAGTDKDPLTDLRLQLLLYYTRAWFLIVRESELFPEDMEAGPRGPVVPEVSRHISDPVGTDAPLTLEPFNQAPDLPPLEADFVRSVWMAYHSLPTRQLARMAHDEMHLQRIRETLPKDEYGDGSEPGAAPIRAEDLEECFKQQAIPEPIMAYRQKLRLLEEEAEKQLATIPRLSVDMLPVQNRSYTTAAQKLCTTKE